jgi:hypothetical protein
MGLVDVGNQQNGLNADTSYAALNGTIAVPPGGYLPVGMPFTRNLLVAQGNYLSRFAALPGLGAFANGDEYTQFVQGGAVLATTGASNVVGAYIGQPTSNPWLNGPAGTLNTSILQAPSYLARSGLRPVLVCVPASGTNVKVGDFVVKGVTIGTTAINPFLVSIGGATATAGITVGQVAATPIWSQIVTASTAGVSGASTVNNTNGMSTTIPLVINPGGANQETVTPTAVTAASPAVAALTIVGVAGAASTVQITFNIAGYQGSTGLTGPTGTGVGGTAVTTFTITVPIANGTTLQNTTNAILAAIQASGFAFGASQNILGIGAGPFTQNGANAGSPIGGPLVYASASAAGVINFTAANPGAWANTLLTYTVTVPGGVTQTFNGSATGSATAVAFANGVNGTFTATLQNAHSAGENVVGVANTSQAVIVPVPGTTGMINTGLVYVDMLQM